MNIETFIKNFVLSHYSTILVINVNQDKLYEFKYLNNEIKYTKGTTYTNYLASLNNIIKIEDINGYIEALSINNLIKNNNQVKYKYHKLEPDNNYREYSNYIYYTNNLVIVLEKISSNNKTEINKDILINEISESMFQIYSTLNEENNTNNYVNNILTELIKKFPELNKAFTKNALDITSKGANTILIIDDDNITTKLLTKIFENEYNIITASDGQIAINKLEEIKNKDSFQAKENIVAIFLDLVMPNVDGFTVLDYLNNNNYLSKIPVAIISGDYSKETKNKVYNYKIADMLEKPFNSELIKLRIDNLIKLYKSSNSLTELINNQNNQLKNIINCIIQTYLFNNKEQITKANQLIKQLIIKYNDNNLIINIDNIIKSSDYINLYYYLLPDNFKNKTNYTEKEQRVLDSYKIIGFNLIKYGMKDINEIFLNYCEEIIVKQNTISYNIVSIAYDYLNNKQINNKYEQNLINILNEVINAK